MKRFGQITWLVLQDANRQRKKAERHETEGDSDGLAICTVSRLCPPGAVVTRVVEETIKGVPSVLSFDGNISRQASGICSAERPSSNSYQDRGLDSNGGAASKNTPGDKGYMDAAARQGGRRTHFE